MSKYLQKYFMDHFPPDWHVLHGALTAPRGYVWIANKASMFSPERRIGLVREELIPRPETADMLPTEPTPTRTPSVETTPVERKGREPPPPEYPRTLNRLAREQFKAKLLAEIAFDMQVCLLEGWDAFEFVRELRTELDRIHP